MILEPVYSNTLGKNACTNNAKLPLNILKDKENDLWKWVK